MSHSRRAFLEQVSAAAAAAGLLPALPVRRLWALPAAALVPEPDETLLRELALKAMDAARHAGATFADVRLTAGRHVAVICTFQRSRREPLGMEAPAIGFPIRYGIRAIVDGAWGFAGDTELTADAVARAARTAVAVARGNRPRRPRTLELAPITPVADGIWATPVAQDPLAVPLGEQAELALAALRAASAVPEVTSARVLFQWRRPTTVFATTDGALVVQRLAFAAPSGVAQASVGPSIWDEASAAAEGLRVGGFGYEALGGRALVGAMRAAAERAVALARAARTATPVEVGRYDLVFGTEAVSALLFATLAAAVDAEVALGYRANGGGTSFAAPPADILGTYQAASPLVTVRADRTRPGGAATVGWDEEGVRPEAYTIVEKGVLTDYHTSRETAPQLGAWYRRRGEPVRSHGCMRGCGSTLPQILLPNLTLEPGAGNTTVDDLISGVRNGMYVEDAGGGADQQLLSAQFRAGHTRVRAIRSGKLGGYVKDVALQFITPTLWKSIDALGGPATSRALSVITDFEAWFDPLQPFPHSTFEVVPMRARQVNVLNTGRTA